MKIEPILISIVIFAGALIGMSSFYADVSDSYSLANSTPASEFTTFNETFGKLNSTLEDLEKRTTGFYRKGVFDLSSYYDAVMAFVDVGIIIFQMPGLVSSNISKIFTVIGIYVPPWFILMIMSIIGVIFALRVVAIFTKADEI